MIVVSRKALVLIPLSLFILFVSWAWLCSELRQPLMNFAQTFLVATGEVPEYKAAKEKTSQNQSPKQETVRIENHTRPRHKIGLPMRFPEQKTPRMELFAPSADTLQRDAFLQAWEIAELPPVQELPERFDSTADTNWSTILFTETNGNCTPARVLQAKPGAQKGNRLFLLRTRLCVPTDTPAKLQIVLPYPGTMAVFLDDVELRRVEKKNDKIQPEPIPLTLRHDSTLQLLFSASVPVFSIKVLDHAEDALFFKLKDTIPEPIEKPSDR